MSYYDQVKEAADAIRARVPEPPAIGVVLGSGLGDFANSLGAAVAIPYGELPHWPASRVIGHEGKLVVGTSGGRTIAALAGRVHLYEGHDARTVTFATRVLTVTSSASLALSPEVRIWVASRLPASSILLTRSPLRSSSSSSRESLEFFSES